MGSNPNRRWIPAFAGMTWLFVASAHADCLRPAVPSIPGPDAVQAQFRRARVQVADYLARLDAYRDCMKDAAAGMKPLDAMAAYRESDRAFALMQQAVDGYDAALAARENGS